ncbi:S8 family serine peptidase [Candidatus Leptofilum sp.]|uniref:S8 family serine peptidase n=1 Tax=Candidatus Leptofilum sp. TaxID=3241576 RepID=UPI003B5AF8A4
MVTDWVVRGLKIVFGAIFLAFFVGQAGAEPDFWGKIDPFLLAESQSGIAENEATEVEFLVQMAVQADLSAVAELEGKLAKGTFVYEQLTAVAQQTQAPLLAQLDELGVDDVRPFWITNMVWVRSNPEILTTIAQRSDVAMLYANPQVALDVLPPENEFGFNTTATNAVEWNISHIGADLAWSAGFTGQGVVIGGQDTGYDWDHPALINQYRGWDGNTANHDYNWHDAIHTLNFANICGVDSPEPCDDFGSSHGTHTMGTMVGNDLASTAEGWPNDAVNAIGVAPGAKWIGCRNMEIGNGTPASYTECYEWFVAPYPIGGDPMTDGDPAMAPHVINNSWGCPSSEGCSAATLESVVNNVRAAGIVTVHSAGNSGPGCGTVDDPAATYPASFTVGATDSGDNIASFSSRGPSDFDGGLKPDIVAPGLSISSTIRVELGSYGLNSGTSMAAPHVAGLVALLISANPSLAGDVDGIEAILRGTAVPLTSSQGCGGDGPTDVPNHVYGYGRIDALAPILQQFIHKTYLPFSANE